MTIYSRLRSAGSAVVNRFNNPETTSKRLVPGIIRHKKMLAERAFSGLPDFCFVFQTFNKSHLVERLLQPFLELDARNVIFFADGCIDKTIEKASPLLIGKNHLIIHANDVHEIRNYRTSIPIATDIFVSKYLVLLQDDDLYDANVRAWLDACSSLMDRFPDLAIIGLNGGANPVGPCSVADDAIQTAAFETWREDSRVMYRLADYMRCEVSGAEPTRDGHNWNFCALVNRAPQVIRLDFLRAVDCFPLDMCPFQYDDYYNCLSAWANGWKVIHMPIAGVARNVGIGGMRLVNNVTPDNRPAHFKDNWNKIVQVFGGYWERVATDVAAASRDAVR